MGVGKVVGGQGYGVRRAKHQVSTCRQTLNESATVMVLFQLIIVQTNLKSHDPIIYRYKCGGRPVVLAVGGRALGVRVTNMR